MEAGEPVHRNSDDSILVRSDYKQEGSDLNIFRLQDINIGFSEVSIDTAY